MRYITITTPDNVEVNYRLAGAGSRCAAAMIDFLVQVAFVALLLFVEFKLIYGNFEAIQEFIGTSPLSSFVIALDIIILLVIYLGYFIISEMAMNGQSLGKKIFKLRVIQDNGRPINFFQSVLRNVLRLTIDQLGVGVVVILFSKKFKRVGDMLALTVVVAENARIDIPEQLILEALEPNTNENFVLKPDEYYTIQDFLRREPFFTDGGVSALTVIQAYLKARFGADFDRNAIIRLVENNRGLVHHGQPL